jgi:hypothetical protein
MPRKIEGMTDTKAEEVYNSSFDLTSIVSTKSQDELLEILDEHFFVKPTLLVENKAFQQKQAAVVEASGEFSAPKASDSDDDTSPFASDSEDDDNLKKLLADLD